MLKTREEMQDNLIHTLGFEDEFTISFFQACETHPEDFWNEALNNLYDAHMNLLQVIGRGEE
jgi:hypothetical protein